MDLSPKEVTTRSEADADEGLRKALSRWFGIRKPDYNAWKDGRPEASDVKAKAGKSEPPPPDDEGVEEDDEEVAKAPASLEELMVDDEDE